MAEIAELDQLGLALKSALLLQPSPRVENLNKPEVEIRSSPDLLQPHVFLQLGDSVACLIEGSVNSARVSFRFTFEDQISSSLLRSYLKFAMSRYST